MGYRDLLGLHLISVPLLYLRATEDRVVPPAASRAIIQNAPRSRVVDLVAPHFLLQTRPNDAALLIEEFVQEVENAL